MHVLEREVVNEDRDLSLATTLLVSGGAMLWIAVDLTDELGWFKTAGIIVGILFVGLSLLVFGLYLDFRAANDPRHEETAHWDNDNPDNWHRWESPRQ